MRVVLFTDTLGDVNGVSRFIRTAAAHALATGRELTVVTSTRFDVPDAPNVVNVQPRRAWRMPRYEQLEIVLPRRASLFAAADARRPTVVHVSTPGPVGIAGRAYALRHKLPLAGTYHTDFPAYIDHLLGHEPLTHLCSAGMRWFYRPFGLLFSRSADYALRLEQLGVAHERLERLRPGIDLSSFDPGFARADCWRDYPGVRAGSVKVLCIGRVSVEKNLPLLTDLWPGVQGACASRGVDAQLIVIGDGPYRPEMERRLAPGGHAVFLGFRHGAELSKLYASCDLLCFPSRTDTLGQVVMEAQASGMPVLVADKGGPKEVVRAQAGPDGLATGLVLPNAPGAWRDALVAMVCEHDRRRAMGRAARDFMARFTFAASFEHFWTSHARTACPAARP
jgi:glycosyltransferase involved in cell wall biosynthesis